MKGLMMVGELYNLSPRDLWKANSRVNQSEFVSGQENTTQRPRQDKGKSDGSACKSPLAQYIELISINKGKYLEIWTIWTKLDTGIDETLSKRIWRTRHIGLLFSKQATF